MMQYPAYLAMAFIALQLINVLLNFFFRQKIRKTEQSFDEPISVLIPARNEEHNIGFLLDDLSKVKNPKLEIIVCDDQSTDNTSAIVQKYAEADKRITLMHSKELPEAWLGKNHACYQLACRATGKYFLFVDADVRLHGNVIEDIAMYFKKYRLGLLSVFPVQIQKTIGEKLSVPMMNYILLTLLPLIYVRVSPFTSHAAANGQFMFFNAVSYRKTQPHKLHKSSPVEDIAIARYFKKQNITTACITGESRIQCRMYKNYKDALNGFTKNVFMFFGNSRVFAFAFWILTALGFIPVWLAFPKAMLVYLATLLAILLMYSYISKQNIVLNVLLFPLQLLFLFQVMIKNIVNKKQKQYLWKGRNIYS